MRAQQNFQDARLFNLGAEQDARRNARFQERAVADARLQGLNQALSGLESTRLQNNAGLLSQAVGLEGLNQAHQQQNIQNLLATTQTRLAYCNTLDNQLMHRRTLITWGHGDRYSLGSMDTRQPLMQATQTGGLVFLAAYSELGDRLSRVFFN